MTFHKEKVAEFLQIFETVKNKIRSMEGCESLDLLQDKEDSRILFTYSYWREEGNLENYRKSELFKEVWADVKSRFEEKAEAWSVNRLSNL